MKNSDLHKFADDLAQCPDRDEVVVLCLLRCVDDLEKQSGTACRVVGKRVEIFANVEEGATADVTTKMTSLGMTTTPRRGIAGQAAHEERTIWCYDIREEKYYTGQDFRDQPIRSMVSVPILRDPWTSKKGVRKKEKVVKYVINVEDCSEVGNFSSQERYRIETLAFVAATALDYLELTLTSGFPASALDAARTLYDRSIDELLTLRSFGEAVFDTTSDALIIVDEKERIKQFNPRAAHVLNDIDQRLAQEESLIGKPVRELYFSPTNVPEKGKAERDSTLSYLKTVDHRPLPAQLASQEYSRGRVIALPSAGGGKVEMCLQAIRKRLDLSSSDSNFYGEAVLHLTRYYEVEMASHKSRKRGSEFQLGILMWDDGHFEHLANRGVDDKGGRRKFDGEGLEETYHRLLKEPDYGNCRMAIDNRKPWTDPAPKGMTLHEHHSGRDNRFVTADGLRFSCCEHVQPLLIGDEGHEEAIGVIVLDTTDHQVSLETRNLLVRAAQIIAPKVHERRRSERLRRYERHMEEVQNVLECFRPMNGESDAESLGEHGCAITREGLKPEVFFGWFRLEGGCLHLIKQSRSPGLNAPRSIPLPSEVSNKTAGVSAVAAAACLQEKIVWNRVESKQNNGLIEFGPPDRAVRVRPAEWPRKSKGDPWEAQSEIALPVKKPGTDEVVGVLCYQTEEPFAYGGGEQRALEILAAAFGAELAVDDLKRRWIGSTIAVQSTAHNIMSQVTLPIMRMCNNPDKYEDARLFMRQFLGFLEARATFDALLPHQRYGALQATYIEKELRGTLVQFVFDHLCRSEISDGSNEDILREKLRIIIVPSNLMSAIPYGRVGIHALTSIVENIVRNQAKYGDKEFLDKVRRKEEVLVFTIRFEKVPAATEEEGTAYIRIDIESNCPSLPGTEDTLSGFLSDHVSTKDEGALVPHKGLFTCKMCAAFLRGIPLEQIDQAHLPGLVTVTSQNPDRTLLRHSVYVVAASAYTLVQDGDPESLLSASQRSTDFLILAPDAPWPALPETMLPTRVLRLTQTGTPTDKGAPLLFSEWQEAEGTGDPRAVIALLWKAWMRDQFKDARLGLRLGGVRKDVEELDKLPVTLIPANKALSELKGKRVTAIINHSRQNNLDRPEASYPVESFHTFSFGDEDYTAFHSATKADLESDPQKQIDVYRFLEAASLKILIVDNRSDLRMGSSLEWASFWEDQNVFFISEDAVKSRESLSSALGAWPHHYDLVFVHQQVFKGVSPEESSTRMEILKNLGDRVIFHSGVGTPARKLMDAVQAAGDGLLWVSLTDLRYAVLSRVKLSIVNLALRCRTTQQSSDLVLQS